uniref:Thioredoxin_14 domain-containing protein n=1 Tax=Panagrellus redivivus TaxID=6233 RepID=A0A7E4VTM1_PANRE
MPFPVLPDGLDGMLISNLSGLFKIKLGLTSLSMLDISPHTLLKFFLAQRNAFELELCLLFDEPKSKTEAKVAAMLDNNFKLKPPVYVTIASIDAVPRAVHIMVGSSKSQRHGPPSRDEEDGPTQKLSTYSGLRSSTCFEEGSFFENSHH